MRTPRLLLGLLLTGAAMSPAVPGWAEPVVGTTTVSPAAEAWYRSTPACALPTDCVDATGAPSPYPADTLHVGVAGGYEESRTYLRLDLTQLPFGTKAVGGTLLLPVGPQSDGSVSPETAELRACAVTGNVRDVDGSFAKPPEADCNTASVPLKLLAASGSNPAAFTGDLGPIVSAWQAASAPGAVAIVPAEGAAPPDQWHVAFSRRTRTGAGVVRISASLAYVAEAVDTDDQPAPQVEVPDFAPAPRLDPGGAAVVTGSRPAAPSTGQPPTVAGPAAPQPLVPAASVAATPFRYPGVFLLPLLMAVGAAWVGRAFTRDLNQRD